VAVAAAVPDGVAGKAAAAVAAATAGNNAAAAAAAASLCGDPIAWVTTVGTGCCTRWRPARAAAWWEASCGSGGGAWKAGAAA